MGKKTTLASIGFRNIYHDKFSKERKYPYGVKAKNKLSTKKIGVDVYPFLILTSGTDAVRGRHTVEFVRDEHVEDRHPTYMAEPVGRCEVTYKNLEVLAEDEVLAKINDRRNGFEKAGRLCHSKWVEVFNRLDVLDRTVTPTQIKELIDHVAPSGSQRRLLRDLGL